MSGFFLSPRVAWGTGAIEQLSGLGVRRATLLVDPAVARRDGARRLVEELEKSDATVEVEPAGDRLLYLDELERLSERLRAHPPDAVVALGGGRTIDGAKAARLRVARPDLSLSNFPPLLEPPPAGPLVVAVPTTSGSGSDASWTVDLRTPDGAPLEIAHRSLIPDWSLLDPALAASLAPAERIDGALQALALACEAYLSAWANPLSDALALDAATTVVQRLPHAVRWSDDPDASAALHYAASAAGLAASNAQRGTAHALARALELPSGLPYGRLMGILLPAVLDFDHPSARERLERLADRARARDERGEMALSQRLRRLYSQLPFPATIRAAGGKVDRIEADRPGIVAHVLRSPGALASPRVPTAKEVDALVASVLG